MKAGKNMADQADQGKRAPRPGNWTASGKAAWTGPRQLAEIVPELLDPMLQKRAGLSSALVSCWPEIAGAALADGTRPEKITWSRSDSADDAQALLTIAADPAFALALQHQTGAVKARVNAFFGYPAIDRVRIVQKAVAAGPAKPRQVEPDSDAKARAAVMSAGVTDDGLRAALARLGAHVLARTSRHD
jgi:hypothetical protein